MNDVRVRVAKAKAYYYPDLLVSYAREGKAMDMASAEVEDAVLIVEILSQGTEATDRREKLVGYRTLSSLVEYALISHSEPDQFVTGLLLVAIAVARMRCEGVDRPRPVESDPFKIIQLPECITGYQRFRAQRRAADTPIGADGDQTEGMLFFIFNDQKTPVRKPLDGGWLIEAGQGQEHENVVQRHDGHCLLLQTVGASEIQWGKRMHRTSSIAA